MFGAFAIMFHLNFSFTSNIESMAYNIVHGIEFYMSDITTSCPFVWGEKTCCSSEQCILESITLQQAIEDYNEIMR